MYTFLLPCTLEKPLAPASWQSMALPPPGKSLVTDLQLWAHDPAFAANRDHLTAVGAHIVSGIDLYALHSTWSEAATNVDSLPSINLKDIGMVVFGGFHPHHAPSAVVQSLAHQLPKAHSILALYASRDSPPTFHDRHMLHLQTWTADSDLIWAMLSELQTDM